MSPADDEPSTRYNSFHDDGRGGFEKKTANTGSSQQGTRSSNRSRWANICCWRDSRSSLSRGGGGTLLILVFTFFRNQSCLWRHLPLFLKIPCSKELSGQVMPQSRP